MPLTRYGRREWLAISLVAAAAGALLWWLHWWWALGAAALLWLAGVAFFRDPRRTPPPGLAPGTMLSAADGRVTAIERVAGHPAVEGPALVVRVFLSVLDVHVNRSPADGLVLSVEHRPGACHDARSPRSAVENECTLTRLRLDLGPTIGVRQITGKVARRIVCDLRPGDVVRRGQRFGMIKFGSGTELILPDPDRVVVHVKVGDRVRGGLTPLATLAGEGTEGQRD